MKLHAQAVVVGAATLVVAGLLASRLAYRPGARPVAPGASSAAQPFSDATLTYWPPGPANRKVVARIEAKIKLAHDVIEGRLPLLQAAAAFRDLDRDDPRTLPPLADRFPQASSVDEIYCRSVIGYVRAEAPPDRADQATSGLEAELAARLRDGTLRLPGP